MGFFDAVLADKLGGVFLDAGQQRGLLLRAQVAAPDTDQAAAAVDGFDYQLLDIGGHELQVAGVAAPVGFYRGQARLAAQQAPADFRQVFEQDGVFQHAGPQWVHHYHAAVAYDFQQARHAPAGVAA